MAQYLANWLGGLDVFVANFYWLGIKNIYVGRRSGAANLVFARDF